MKRRNNVAFWKKKSEDPWDLDPNRPKKPVAAPVPAGEPERTIPPWVHKAEQPDSVPCPWCGEPMLSGFLYGNGRGSMQWREGPWRGGLDALRFTGRKIDLGGSEEAWYCASCQKLTLDIEGMLEKAGPNYVWKDGKVVFPEELEEEL